MKKSELKSIVKEVMVNEGSNTDAVAFNKSLRESFSRAVKPIVKKKLFEFIRDIESDIVMLGDKHFDLSAKDSKDILWQELEKKFNEYRW